MELSGKKLIVIGGAGLIGSHTVDRLLKEDVQEVVVYDNFVRGREENLANALADPRVKIYDVGGDIMQTDILQSALVRTWCLSLCSLMAFAVPRISLHRRSM